MKATAFKILVLGAAIATSTAIAKADQISAAGTDSYTSSTITFDTIYPASGGSGIFSDFNGGTVTFNGTLDFTTNGGVYPPYEIYSITNGANSITFFGTSDTWAVVPDGDGPGHSSLRIVGSGYYTGNEFSGDIPGTFGITTQGEPNGCTAGAPSTCLDAGVTVTFSGTGFATTPSPTPEPSSLVLLGSSLLGAAAIARRRFASRLS